MVTRNPLARGLLSLVFVLSLSLTAHAQVPSSEDIGTLAVGISNDIETFKGSVTKRNFETLLEKLQQFKGLIKRVGQGVSREKGGAATPRAVEAVREISDFGIDIGNALFVIRTEQLKELQDKNLEQKFEDAMVNEVEHPMLEMAFDAMRHGVDERSNVDGRVTNWDVIRRTGMEVGRDVFKPISGGRNRSTGEFYYTPIENYRREQMIRRLVTTYAENSAARIPEFNKLYDGNLEYDRDRHEERLGGLLLWLSDRAVNIRVERDSAQSYAKYLYLGTGLALGLPFQLNFLGDSYSAHLETSIMVISAFAALYVIKGAISSVTSTGIWWDFNQKVRKEMAEGLVKSTEKYLKKTFPTEYYPGQVPTWIERRIRWRRTIMDAFMRTKGACEDIAAGILSGKKTEAK